jgi:acetyl esterase/lipase
MRKALALTAIFLLAESQPTLTADAGALPEDLARRFAYDASLPLGETLTLLYERDDARTYDLVYSSPKGGKVTGFVVTPATGRGPFAGIVFGHWGPGNRTEFLPEAVLYAQAGAVSVLLDYPWVRPAPHRVNQGKGFDEPEKDKASWEAAVVDLRRAIDLLVARPDVDRARIGYVGHSYGAQWGAILTALDRRVKASVLMGGVPSGESTTVETDDPGVVAMVKGCPPERLETYFRINRPYDAIRYVPYAAPTPLLFQFARHERFVTDGAMRRYFDAASTPKLERWYDTGHELNDPRALADRSAWLAPKLGLPLMAPILAKRLATDIK